MSLLTRVTTTIATQVERLVGDLENHDAIIDAGIREKRRLYAKARVRHSRLQQEGERLRHRLEASRSDAVTWRSRALSCGDEDTALECLRRSKGASARLRSLESALAEHARIESRLHRELEAVRQRVEDLESRRQAMRSRAATADAAERVRVTGNESTLDLDGDFERWEERVIEAELNAGATPASDCIETRFASEEERTALKAELAALLREREASDEN